MTQPFKAVHVKQPASCVTLRSRRPWQQVKATVEANHPGVLVSLVPDVTSSWSPEFQVIMIAEHLTPIERVCAIALMLAHRALGHWGRGAWQLIEAQELAVRWLVTRQHLHAAQVAARGAAGAVIAEMLGVTEAVVALAVALYGLPGQQQARALTA